MKFPKHNPFAIAPVYWEISFIVHMDIALALEESFADIALSTSNFETADDARIWQVTILTDHAPAPKDISERIHRIGELLNTVIPLPHVEEIRDRDWLSAVARDFPPLSIGRFFVHGCHAKEEVPHNVLAIQVEAGTAFGSGEHATTRGCLLALDRLSRERNFSAILDMGCGSAILAIGAAKLWPRANVLAVDNDAVSVRVAQDNIRINRVNAQVRAMVGDGYNSARVHRDAPYDLILANILARPLVGMSHALASHLGRSGIAILSGLLDAQSAMVIAAHRRQGLHLAGRIRDNGWCTLIMEKK